MSKYQTLNEAYLSVYEGYNPIDEPNFVPLNQNKMKRVKNRVDDLLNNKLGPITDKVEKLRKKPFSRFRPGVKKKQAGAAIKGLKIANLAMNGLGAIDKTAEYNNRKANALRSIITALSPHNKIVKFQREELEFVLDYLFENGYADTYSSAAVIAESMSDQWIDMIFEKLSPEDQDIINRRVLSKGADEIQKTIDNIYKGGQLSQKPTRKARQRRLEFEVR